MQTDDQITQIGFISLNEECQKLPVEEQDALAANEINLLSDRDIVPPGLIAYKIFLIVLAVIIFTVLVVSTVCAVRHTKDDKKVAPIRSASLKPSILSGDIESECKLDADFFYRESEQRTNVESQIKRYQG